MQNIINAVDKATKAGVYSLEEVLAVAKSIENLGKIVQEYNQNQAAAKDAPQGLQPSNEKVPEGSKKED